MTFLFPLFLILYEFCTNMSNDMYLSALPRISKDFLTSANLVQLTIMMINGLFIFWSGWEAQLLLHRP